MSKSRKSPIAAAPNTAQPVAKGACPKCGRPLKQGAAWHVQWCDGVRRTPEEIAAKREAQRARRHRKRLGPHSRRLRSVILNAPQLHTREGMFLRRVEEELTRHLGGNLTVVEALLVARTAQIALRLELLDKRIASGKPVGAHEARIYSALLRQYRFYCRELGLKGKQAAEPKLVELMAAERRAG